MEHMKTLNWPVHLYVVSSMIDSCRLHERGRSLEAPLLATLPDLCAHFLSRSFGVGRWRAALPLAISARPRPFGCPVRARGPAWLGPRWARSLGAWGQSDCRLRLREAKCAMTLHLPAWDVWSVDLRGMSSHCGAQGQDVRTEVSIAILQMLQSNHWQII